MLLKLELCGLLTWERGIAHGRERDWRMLLVLGTFSKAPRPGRPPLEPGAQLCVCETGVAQSPLSPATSVITCFMEGCFRTEDLSTWFA